MKVDEYKTVYEKTSGKLSEINRNIAFAGIAIIWIFTKTDTQIVVPSELVLPAIFLVLSLIFDMLQYAYKTVIYAVVFRNKEKEIKRKKLNRDEEFDHSPTLNIITWTLWVFKIAFVILAYCIIFNFLVCTIV
jgi:hypothetical protein